ncbi:putative IQ motif, EF-hand binding, P-loop containing nucleoside triphosphate hydrolase [Lupinus albus]|uniref:Putative IQ motif, EF-hand binding, P-loop containing nucleoside triphosphate hydrolase n=1 Tax=Lupinus albus TaxID=3870 RepID=A0A6A4PPK9_LUPAL|nr:putative IQ motif, EF-hand binding, P-loop containing nucleoside triphosphate hydrolase [Lupinus albus]
MGKPVSCFKLITCGGGASETDESQVNDSNDKSGWSFRKKSVRHRVLSNTVNVEAPSSANKQSTACDSFNFQALPEPNAVEKVYTKHSSEEKPQVSSLESSQMPETISIETESKEDVSPPESAFIIIQAAIRGLLAQRDLLQRKNAVKLQAAIRGHLVRKHAIGTLRCVQAIIKMQALVRARHAQKYKNGRNDSSKNLCNENHITKSNVTYTSIEKLLSNRFASQLLESTPKSKPIHVKCNPSKADSAWKWLERWMSVLLKDTPEYKKSSSLTEQSDIIEDRTSAFQFESGISSKVYVQSADSKPDVGDPLLPSRDEEKLTSYDSNNSGFQESFSTPYLVTDNLKQGPPKKSITYDDTVKSAEFDFFRNENLASDSTVPLELNSLPEKLEIDGEQCKRSMKRFASDQLEAEGKKSVNGSRKLSNPAFIAAQSKFQELSSMTNSGWTNSLSNQDATVVSQADISSVSTDTAYRSKELPFENLAPYLSQVVDSECGTELSISSTLDSPDISETGAVKSERDARDLVQGIGNLENTTNHYVETNIPCVIPASSSATSVLDHTEIVNDISGNMVQSVVTVDSEERAIGAEKNSPVLPSAQVESSQQDFRPSLEEASPRSHITGPESQGTPSSQISIKLREGKISKTGSSKKRGTQSVDNKSPANANNDKSLRGSMEKLPKDHLSGKRRSSFGSVKPDHVDHEPSDNISNNNSLPRFMQVTESAKAKINANTSPRSSPDVHDEDIQLKKRHSLPGATGRQVSPRIQRSMSHAQQSAKGNGVHPPQERKWLR